MFAVSALAVAGLAACQPADSDEETGWRAEQRSVRIGINLPSEVLGMGDDEDLLAEAISDRIELPTEIIRVGGVDSLVQALAADQVDVASFGAGGYASAHDLLNGELTPVLASRDHSGTAGYYSVLMVRADSPYHSLQDLAGARVGYADFNSTSGYLYPRDAMRREGVEADTHFGETGITGGHMQSVMAIDAGQYDAIFTMAGGGTPETGFTTGAPHMLAERDVISMADYRFVWSAGPIPNSAYVIRSDKDQALVDLITGVLAALPYEQPEALEAYGLSRALTHQVVRPDHFDAMIALRQREIEGGDQ